MEKPFKFELSLSKIKNWVKVTVLGGVFVIAPVASILALFVWLFKSVNIAINPITSVIERLFGFNAIFSDLIALSMIVGLCFLVGLIVKTQYGKHVHSKIDGKLAKLAPGYKMIKGILGQFLDDSKDNPLTNGKPCLVKIFGADVPTMQLGFIMSYHERQDIYGVMVPTCPTPFSGLTQYVKSDQVILLGDYSSEETLKTIVACGVGSNDMLDYAFPEENKEDMLTA